MDSDIQAEVVSIGTELVLGQIIDTNAAFIARALSEIGAGLAYHTTVGDDRARMAGTLRLAMKRCPVVITTGGIGPTEDDLTREVWAEVLGRELLFRPELWEGIKSMFKRAGFNLSPNNRRQAFTPDGSETIENSRGTAPAFCYADNERLIFCLPGVPSETEPMIREEVLPRIEKKFNLGGRIIQNRVLKVYGLGESNVDARIKEVIVSSENPTIGLQASAFETLVRLTATASSREEARVLLDRGEERVRGELGEYIFGTDDETLPGNAARLLEEKNLSLAMVDTVTRGAICSEMGRVVKPELFKGGLILDTPAPPVDLCERAGKEFKADVVLALAAFEEEEGRFRAEALVTGPLGQGKWTQEFKGPMPIILRRAGAMALFTLYTFLRDEK
jgi:nicotinamide-nucleotide amidase